MSLSMSITRCRGRARPAHVTIAHAMIHEPEWLRERMVAQAV
jgi:hypothetical protein